jgi:hypothetical protein
MDDAGHLLAQRFDQLRVIVAERVDCDAREAVQVAAARIVEQPYAVAMADRQRLRRRWASGGKWRPSSDSGERVRQTTPAARAAVASEGL